MAPTLAETVIVSVLKTGSSSWNGCMWRIGYDANGTMVLQRLSGVYGWVTTARGSDAEMLERFQQITSA